MKGEQKQRGCPKTMEFADLVWHLFREKGYHCHIQPFFRLPRSAAKGAQFFDPSSWSHSNTPRRVSLSGTDPVRVVMLGYHQNHPYGPGSDLRKYEKIIIAYHPIESLVLLHYSRRLSYRDRRRQYISHSVGDYGSDWQVLCPITNLNVMDQIVSFVDIIHGGKLPKLKPRRKRWLED